MGKLSTFRDLEIDIRRDILLLYIYSLATELILDIPARTGVEDVSAVLFLDVLRALVHLDADLVGKLSDIFLAILTSDSVLTPLKLLSPPFQLLNLRVGFHVFPNFVGNHVPCHTGIARKTAMCVSLDKLVLELFFQTRAHEIPYHIHVKIRANKYRQQQFLLFFLFLF